MRMTTTQTLQLIKALKPKLGEKTAAELVSFIQDSRGSEDFATRSDIKGIEGSIRSDMKEMESSLRSDMKEMEGSLRSDMKEMEISLRKEIHGLTWKLLGGMTVLLGIFTSLARLTG